MRSQPQLNQHNLHTQHDQHQHQHQHQQHHISSKHQDNFITNNNLPPRQKMHQSSSPSDQSMSTATPPQQTSRASPASTALVMSQTNIDGQLPNSRQLTPNTSSSNNGTGSSSNGNTGGGHHGNCAPTGVSMARQFAHHAKSMSTGVVVSVPGITNNLATATGMHQNNMINNHIAATVQARQRSHMQQSAANSHNMHTVVHQQQQQHHQPPPPPLPQHQMQHDNTTTNSNMAPHHRNTSSRHLTSRSGGSSYHAATGSQQVPGIATAPVPQNRTTSHHHQQLSQPATSMTLHHQNNSMQQQQSAPHHQPHFNASQTGTSNNPHSLVVGGRPPKSGSSIVLSSMNSMHNRSASTHLSSMLLNTNGAPPQPHHNGPQNHTQSSHHMSVNAPSSRTTYQQQTNSIWSIDENISKSHNKLTASGFIHSNPLLFPSITDMSCDNVSNVSRFMHDGAPGYYQPHQHSSSAGLQSNRVSGKTSGHPVGSMSASGTLTGKQPEFLPLCDLLFNLISMILYFCDNVFSIIALIALYYHAQSKYWALIGAMFVLASNVICQYLSIKWLYKSKLDDCRRKREAQEELEEEENCGRRYYNRMLTNLDSYQCGSCSWLPDSATEVQLKFLLSVAFDAIMHIFCLGFLIRYIKLVIPVRDTARVKNEARDLCMLRVTHALIQSAPLLLLQSYIICSQTSAATITNLSVTSATLSLLNLCWAYASFTKYARRKYMHKFMLTWLGIVSQLLWRFGTISSRVVALTIYAVYYGYWMLIVLAFHWLSMFLWLVKPGNLLRDELNLPRYKKLAYAMATAWMYCICYINFEEHNSKLKMISYYCIIFLEDNLLLTVSLIFSSQVTWFKNLSIVVVYLGFTLGIMFMMLYYKYFHVNVLDDGLACSQDSIDSIADQLSPAGKKIAGFKPGTLRLKSEDSLTSANRFSTHCNNASASLHTGSHPEITRTLKPPYLPSSQPPPPPHSTLFNCKSNLDIKKPKIPSSHSQRHN